MIENKFETRAPSAQTAVDIFKGAWASNVGEIIPGIKTGGFNLFQEDDRPRLAAETLGLKGRFDGLKLLELGPLEGAHTYQLDRLGAASILGIEANVEAYLKSLIVKELVGIPSANLMCGDFVEHLEENDDHFDLVFCSGVLYHMSDPLNLIRLISKVTDKCFIWTHYYEGSSSPTVRTARQVHKFGFEANYYEAVYADSEKETFWGGNRPVAAWITKDCILSFLRHVGFRDLSILRDITESPVGPHISIAASR